MRSAILQLVTMHAVKLSRLLKTASVTSMCLRYRNPHGYKRFCSSSRLSYVPETLLQTKLNDDVTHFTIPPTNQTCLPMNQVVSGCETLLQKVKSSFTFCNKTCRYCAFYRPKISLRLAQVVSSVYGATSA